MSHRTTWHVLFCTLLALGALLIYRSQRDAFFFSDDFRLLEEAKRSRWGELLVPPVAVRHGPERYSPYFRPGWKLAFKALYETAGLDPRAYMAAGAALHLLVLILIYAFLVHRGTPLPAAAAAAAWFLSSPTYLEGVFWPAASLNVLPAALCILLSVWAGTAFLERKVRVVWGAWFLLFCISLLFKEAAYGFLLLVPAQVYLLGTGPSRGWRLRRALAAAIPFAAVILFHYLRLNRYSGSGLSPGETLMLLFRTGPEYIRSICPVPDIGPYPWIVFAIFVFVLFRAATPMGRFLLCWTALAPFPFAFRAYASRFAYFLHVPAALALGVFLGGLWSAPTGRVRAMVRVLAAPTLLLLLGFNLSRVAPALAEMQRSGEVCRRILAWCRDTGIAREKKVCVDFVPPPLQNGLESMIHLYLGGRVEIVPLRLFSLPPFLVYGNPMFDTLPPEAGILRFQPPLRAGSGSLTFPSYRRFTKEELCARNIVLPLVGFRYQYRVVPLEKSLEWLKNHPSALQTTLLLHEHPAVELPFANPRPGQARILSVLGIPPRKLAFQVETRTPCFLLLCFPKRLDRLKRGYVRMDGVPCTPLHADIRFNAMILEPGRHRIEIFSP